MTTDEDAPSAGDITVLIADDEPLVRSGLRAILDSEPGLRVLGEAGDGARGGGAGSESAAGRDLHGRPDARPRRAAGH